MYTRKLLIAILFISSISASCKKNTADTLAVVIPKVKIFETSAGTELFTYDTQGRLLTRTNATSNWKYEYVYGTNLVTENYYVGTTLSYSNRIELQTNGLARRIFSPGDVYQTAYTYNTNNLVEKKVNSNLLNSNTTTEQFYYTGNLLDSTRKTFSSNTDVYRTHFTYYTDKENTIGFKNKGYLFYAEEEARPVKTVTYIFSPTNTQILNYTYKFDAQGRLVYREINGGAAGINDIDYY